MSVTPVRGNHFPESTDAFTVHLDLKQLAEDLDLALDVRSGALDDLPPSPAKPTLYVVVGDPAPTNNGLAFIYLGGSWRALLASKTDRRDIGFSLDVGVQPGDQPPPKWVGLAAGQTAAIVSCRYQTEAGTATFSVLKNGAAVAGLTNKTADTTLRSATATGGSLAVVDGTAITINVSAAAGCTGLGVTVYIDVVG